jgi:hypothetical protein
MPTRCSMSRATALEALRSRPRCRAAASRICSPTVLRGFRAVMGSWKIMAMRLPRMPSHGRSVLRVARSTPRYRMFRTPPGRSCPACPGSSWPARSCPSRIHRPPQGFPGRSSMDARRTAVRALPRRLKRMTMSGPQAGSPGTVGCVVQAFSGWRGSYVVPRIGGVGELVAYYVEGDGHGRQDQPSAT